VLGCVWALVMRAGRPEVYAAIGRGADGRVAAPPPGLHGGHTRSLDASEHHTPEPFNGGQRPVPYAFQDLVIRDPVPVDTAGISRLLAVTIGEGPVARWVNPDPVSRRGDSPAYFEIFVEHARQYGEIYTTVEPATGELVGVALWFPFVSPIPPPLDYEIRLKDASGSAFDRARELDAALEEHHPTYPHHYLAFLAVRPDRQNLGVGSALLARHHARIDAAGIPAYLEANDPRNRHLYIRNGYINQTVIRLPDGPPIWPMLRPRGQAAGNS
jgi:GNAT superfamily N-acetyltransferase